ncbi:MAG: aldo/keto reductase, partial [Acidobacteriaceae bacterium]|nr:aldo/keto reductase [Acidobacteriaceae bacterium]
MKYKLLGKTGLQVSVLGFGASPLGNEFGSIDPSEGERAVHAAIDAGINYFDVSPYYGRTLAEQRLGAALAGRRQSVVLGTKCGRYDKDDFDFSAVRVRRSVHESLGRLRTDYLDVLLAHDVEYAHREQIIHDTIPAMRALQQEGKVRCVGVSGLPLRPLTDVAERGSVDVVLSYCHYNLLLRDLDQFLTPVVQRLQIGLVNASPLHMGILTAGGAPSWHPAPQQVRDVGAQVVRLCQSYRAEPTVVALRFCLAHPYVSSTLVGVSNGQQLEENLRALDTEPDRELLAQIETL